MRVGGAGKRHQGPHPPQWDKRERDQTSALRFGKDCRDPFLRGENRGWERACHLSRPQLCQLLGSAGPRPHFLVLGPFSWRRCSRILCLHSSVPFLGPQCTFLIEVRGPGKSSASPAGALSSDHKSQPRNPNDQKRSTVLGFLLSLGKNCICIFSFSPFFFGQA